MQKNNSKHKKSKRVNRRKHYKKSLTKLAFFVVLILLAIFFIFKIKSNRINTKQENTQLIYNNENVSSKLQDEIFTENDITYISLNDTKNIFDENIYQEENNIITTSQTKLGKLQIDSNKVLINNVEKEMNGPVIKKEEKIFIPISELENVYNYDFEFLKDSNIITIDSLNKKQEKACAGSNIKVKEGKNEGRTLDKVKKGNWVIVIEKEEKFAKVRTQNGIIGYVKNKQLGNFITLREDWNEEEKTNTGENVYTKNITKEDISTFEKRQKIINLILQETINNDSMNVKIIYQKEDNEEFTKFKIEIKPILMECGISLDIEKE